MPVLYSYNSFEIQGKCNARLYYIQVFINTILVRHFFEFARFDVQAANSLADLLWEHVHQTWLDGYAAKDNNSWML